MDNNNFGREIIFEAKEYYRKDFMRTVYDLRRKNQMRNLNIFDALADLQEGADPYDLAKKYGYSTENFLYEKMNIAKARICVYLKLKELGNV